MHQQHTQHYQIILDISRLSLEVFSTAADQHFNHNDKNHNNLLIKAVPFVTTSVVMPRDKETEDTEYSFVLTELNKLGFNDTTSYAIIDQLREGIKQQLLETNSLHYINDNHLTLISVANVITPEKIVLNLIS